MKSELNNTNIFKIRMVSGPLKGKFGWAFAMSGGGFWIEFPEFITHLENSKQFFIMPDIIPATENPLMD